MSKRKNTPRSKPTANTQGLRQGWSTAVKALSSVENRFERQLAALLKRNGISTKDASKLLREWGGRMNTERKKGLKELRAGFKAVQERAVKEQKAMARLVQDRVRGALAALNIPSRQEIAELTVKVSELSRRIEAFRR